MAEANFEGKIVSNFGLGEAGLDLRFKPELLAGKRVLNFGCGGDNYSKELKNLGIEADIVDVDLVFDAFNDLVRPVLKGVKWIAHHSMPHSQFAEKITSASRKLAGISGEILFKPTEELSHLQIKRSTSLLHTDLHIKCPPRQNLKSLENS